MLVRLNHPAARRLRIVHDASRPNADPTGTMDVRRRYISQVEIRWRRMITQLSSTIVKQDMLGLDPNKPTALSLALQSLAGDAKILAFQTWIDKALEQFVLENDAAYLDPMIIVSYGRAVARAIRMTKSDVRPPKANEAVASLQQLVVVELQGIMEAVSQQCVRAASNAILNKMLPKDLLTICTGIVNKVGVIRSRALIETLVVKAFSVGTLDQFEAAAIKSVGIIPETLPQLKKQVGDYNPYHVPAGGPEGGQFASSEGGSGALPMTQEARMSRAKAQGFNTEKKFYHGTTSTFSEFKVEGHGFFPFVYVSTNPQTSSQYAMSSLAHGAQVHELLVRGPIGGPDAVLAAKKAINYSGEADTPRLVKEMQKRGFSGHRIKGTETSVIYEPKNLRSTHAVFNPKKISSTGLADAPRRLGPGALLSRLEVPSRSTIGRIAQVAQKLENLGTVEIITAGDDLVCPECLDLEDGSPYSIDEARSLIPAHPYCRCAFAPVEE